MKALPVCAPEAGKLPEVLKNQINCTFLIYTLHYINITVQQLPQKGHVRTVFYCNLYKNMSLFIYFYDSQHVN